MIDQVEIAICTKYQQHGLRHAWKCSGEKSIAAVRVSCLAFRHIFFERQLSRTGADLHWAVLSPSSSRRPGHGMSLGASHSKGVCYMWAIELSQYKPLTWESEVARRRGCRASDLEQQLRSGVALSPGLSVLHKTVALQDESWRRHRYVVGISVFRSWSSDEMCVHEVVVEVVSTARSGYVSADLGLRLC